MNSRPVFTIKKTKLTWYEYYTTHVIPTIFYGIKEAVYLWIKLLQGDTSDYEIYSEYFKYTEEEKFELLQLDFWYSLEDDILDKEFVEHLMQLSEDVKTGKVKTIPYETVKAELIDDSSKE